MFRTPVVLFFLRRQRIDEFVNLATLRDCNKEGVRTVNVGISEGGNGLDYPVSCGKFRMIPMDSEEWRRKYGFVRDAKRLNQN